MLSIFTQFPLTIKPGHIRHQWRDVSVSVCVSLLLHLQSQTLCQAPCPGTGSGGCGVSVSRGLGCPVPDTASSSCSNHSPQGMAEPFRHHGGASGKIYVSVNEWEKNHCGGEMRWKVANDDFVKRKSLHGSEERGKKV